MSLLSAMEYPDWMMVAGAVLPVLGFIGFALAKTGRLRLGHGLRGVNENLVRAYSEGSRGIEIDLARRSMIDH
jgi:hypothetical protein